MVLFLTIPGSLTLYVDKIRMSPIPGIYFVICWNFLQNSTAIRNENEGRQKKTAQIPHPNMGLQSSLVAAEITYGRL